MPSGGYVSYGLLKDSAVASTMASSDLGLPVVSRFAADVPRTERLAAAAFSTYS